MRYLLLALMGLLGFGVLALTYLYFGAFGIKILLGASAVVGIPLSIGYSRDHHEADRVRAILHMNGRPSLSETQFGATYFTGPHADVAARLRNILSRHIPLDISRLQPDDKLVEDIRMDALDSMSTVEFLLEVEREFQLSIPHHVAAKMQTFRDLCEYVGSRIDAGA